MLTPYHTTNRTATTNGPISLAYAAGLGKYGYGNGIVVTERISGTVLLSADYMAVLPKNGVWMLVFLIKFNLKMVSQSLMQSYFKPCTIFSNCNSSRANIFPERPFMKVKSGKLALWVDS